MPVPETVDESELLAVFRGLEPGSVCRWHGLKLHAYPNAPMVYYSLTTGRASRSWADLGKRGPVQLRNQGGGGIGVVTAADFPSRDMFCSSSGGYCAKRGEQRR
jgi:hypothetical protein